jgi:membrane associated rhomboid family serine protease
MRPLLNFLRTLPDQWQLVQFPKPRAITTSIIVVCALSYLAVRVYPNLEMKFALWPLDGTRFHYWQVGSYAFLHLTGTLSHLVMNMYALYLFGSDVERVIKRCRFTIYYLVCIVGAGVSQLIFMHLTNTTNRYVVGASGGVYGVLLAYGLFFPNRRFVLLGISAKTAVFIFGAIELLLGLIYSKPSSAHFAHLGGMAAGYGLILYWRRRN